MTRFLGIAVAGLIFLVSSAAAAEDRIHGAIDRTETIVLRSALHPKATAENDRGPVAPGLAITGITLNFALSATQQADLDQLLEEQRDPSSPNYQKWLTPEDYANRFGLSSADMDKVTTWLRGEGFTLEHVSRSMNWVTFGGTAAQVDRTLRTATHNFLVDGQMHFANTAPPSVPAALKDIVLDFRGLNNFRLQPQHHKVQKINPAYDSGNSHYLAPGDLGTIFNINPLYSANITGTGQSLVIAGQTDIVLSDIAAFRAQFGLSANVPQVVLFGADPGTSSGDMVEADLDLEWSGAVARDAKIIYVNSNDVFSSVQYAISQNLAPVISLSYGGCESENTSALASTEAMAKQANASGITWLASSGDSGAAGCDEGKVAKLGLAVSIPASVPEVTGVGGSTFNEGSGSYWSTTNGAFGGSALGYIPEMAWNDSVSRNELSATGGGRSIFYPKPSWQTGTGVPADFLRDVPDVTLPASPDHDGYEFYTGGKAGIVGGTSASAPSMAGIVVLLNQYLLGRGVISKPGLGNINPNLYHLAASATSPFHDITVGDNIVPCTVGTADCATGTLGYSAGPGYDLATGLGSVDAYNLAASWANLPVSIGTTLSLIASPQSILNTASTTLTATVKPATGSTAPTGAVTFVAVKANGGTVISLGTASLVSGAASLTVSGSSLPAGTYTVTASYAGSTTFSGSTNSVSITVTAPVTTVSTSTTLISSNATPTTTTTTLTAAVVAQTGSDAPTGKVTFTYTAGNTIVTLGTAALVPTFTGASASASFSPAAGKLTPGIYTFTATYSGTTGFGGSASKPLTLTITAPSTLTTTTSVTANPATIASNGSTLVTATVNSTGTSLPTGAVTFSLVGAAGTTTLGQANLSGSTASFTVKGSQLTVGPNTIEASYAGSATYGASSGKVTVTVTGTAPKSAVTATITPNPVVAQGTGRNKAWVFTIKLSNTGGPTTLTAFSVDGTSYNSKIVNFFGSSSIPANGTLSTTLEMTNVQAPTSNVFTFGGTDASGATWTQTVTVSFQ